MRTQRSFAAKATKVRLSRTYSSVTLKASVLEPYRMGASCASIKSSYLLIIRGRVSRRPIEKPARAEMVRYAESSDPYASKEHEGR